MKHRRARAYHSKIRNIQGEKITLDELLKAYVEHLDREMKLVEMANNIDIEHLTLEDKEKVLRSLVSHPHFKDSAIEYPILKETMVSIAEGVGIENARDIIEEVLKEE